VKPTVSVVIPAYNEAAHLGATVEHLLTAIDGSSFEADVLLVDDGSTDGSAEVAANVVAGRIPFRVLRQENQGRFEARRAGVEAATADWVLLLDARVRIHPDTLAFVGPRLLASESVWTGHVNVVADGNAFATFWKLLADLAWADYFDDPRTTSFDSADFDRYPKGTTCFLAPTALLVEAMRAFNSRYSDPRRANDDTPLIRWISTRERIHISPRFACDYSPRTTFGAFVRHSVHRGIVFLDGHGRRDSKFFPVVVAFYPLSLALAVAVARHPRRAPQAAALTGIAAAALGVARKRRAFEIGSLALLAPVYAIAHGAGMWRGLTLIGERERTRRPR
jgi:glycosyltransferase involved in cell wall biosynthesis